MMNSWRRVSLIGVLLAVSTCAPLRADELQRSVNMVMLWATQGPGPDWVQSLPAGDGSELEGLTFSSRLALYTGAATVLSFVELGDKSPLKAQIGEQAWQQLLQRVPLIQQGVTTLEIGLVDELRAAIATPDLQLQFGLTTASAGLLLPASDEKDLFKKGTYIFGSKSLATLALDSRVLSRLALLSVQPGVDPSVRKQAASLVAAGGLLKGQLLVVETAYRSEVGALGGPTGYGRLGLVETAAAH